MIALMGRVLRLDSSVYNDIRTGQGMVTQAAIVVILTGIATAIGSALFDLFVDGQPGFTNPPLVLGSGLATLIGWVIGGAIIWIVAKLFGGNGSFSQLLAALGFAYTPNLLLIFSFIPVLGGLIGLVAFILTFLNTIFAVRSAMTLTTVRAVLVVLIPAIIIFTFILLFVVFLFAAILTAGGG